MARAALVGDNPALVDMVYGKGRREILAGMSELLPEVIGPNDFDTHAEALRDVEVIFSTWGMFPFEDRHFAHIPRLKAVFYAAGSVRHFAYPFLQRGIVVMSAWAANAIPVAEFTLSQILLSCKGYFGNASAYRDHIKHHAAPPLREHGVYGERIALIGAGMVARHLIELLRAFRLEVVVCDPFLSDEEAARLGIKKVALAEAFRTALVVSNHVPNLPETVGMFDKTLFASMRPNATFINTGRGAQVIEPELVEVLRQRTDLTALLDVTDPEPPLQDSPLWDLPNVHLSSHIAGSIGDEVLRMADYCIEAYRDWEAGKPLKYAVTPAMLEKMA